MVQCFPLLAKKETSHSWNTIREKRRGFFSEGLYVEVSFVVASIAVVGGTGFPVIGTIQSKRCCWNIFWRDTKWWLVAKRSTWEEWGCCRWKNGHNIGSDCKLRVHIKGSCSLAEPMARVLIGWESVSDMKRVISHQIWGLATSGVAV